ncbi:MAG TPA: sugar transferase [Longimicrobiales bacterium]
MSPKPPERVAPAAAGDRACRSGAIAVAERAHGAGTGVPADAAGDAPPLPVHDVVRKIREEFDWDAVLPPRARTVRWRVEQRVKRGMDVVVSLAGLIVLAPLFLALAVLVRLTSAGPVLYPWRVLGHRARPFVGYKFRTMVPNADELKRDLLAHNQMRGPVFKMRNDPRVTPVGRWLRKFSLDELPQLWSVLKGDMSLVGPRPPSAEEFAAFEPWQRGKLAVTPGITCLWQVQGRSEIADFNEWAALDLEYIRRWSLWLDLKILLKTIPVVIRGRGAY